MGSDEPNEDMSAAHDADKQARTALVIDTIKQNCVSSTHDLFRKIHRAVEDGGKLEAIILSGGYTNYSYKVFVPGQPELCAFAKLSFEFAIWNPDKNAHYDLARTANEYDIMTTMYEKSPDCIVAPLACWDMERDGQKMKLLVTAWSAADEQFSNQFIDGTVDGRIAPKLADALAELNTIKDFDPDFNEQVKPCMLSLFDQMIEYVKKTCEEMKPKDRTETFCVVLGAEHLLSIVQASLADYNTKDCLVHSDAHVFNILVEAKPSIEKLEQFGPEGKVVLCDWEMAMAGPKGRDLGLALAFPIGCMVAHALNGHADANESINNYINSLLDSYVARMAEAGKTPEEQSAIVRNAAGWAGWFQFLGFYYLGVQMPDFPIDNEEDRKYCQDSMGVLGLKLIRFSYDTKYFPAATTLAQVRKMLAGLVDEEVTETAFARFHAKKKRKQPRKASMLRASDRRVSDAAMNFFAADAVARMSSRELSVGDILPE